MRHISDGITYAGIKRYKCKICGKHLTKEEFINSKCEGPEDE